MQKARQVGSFLTKLRREDLKRVYDGVKDYVGAQKLTNEIRTTLNTDVKYCEYVVDRWPNFEAVAVRSLLPHYEDRGVPWIHVFAHREVGMERLLDNREVVDWEKTPVFHYIDTRYVPLVADIINCHGLRCVLEEEACSMRINPGDLKDVPVTEGFKMKSLLPEQSEMVTARWSTSAGEATNIYLKHVIATQPSVCFYDPNGNVGGYALTYHDGMIGCVYVRKSLRGNGLSASIVSQLLRLNTSTGRALFGIVYLMNEAPLKVYKALGSRIIPNFTTRTILSKGGSGNY